MIYRLLSIKKFFYVLEMWGYVCFSLSWGYELLISNGYILMKSFKNKLRLMFLVVVVCRLFLLEFFGC